MRLERIQLYRFRNHQQSDCTLAAGINLFAGANGTGKTNLLEAVYLVIRQRSFRVASLTGLSTQPHRNFSLRLHFTKTTQSGEKQNALLDFSFQRGTRSLLYKGEKIQPSDLKQQIPALLLFTPEDVQLIQGTSGQRRLFMDKAIAQQYPEYTPLLQTYMKILKQRNHALRRRQATDPWNTPIASAAVKLLRIRMRFVTDLQRYLKGIYGELAQGTEKKIECGYHSKKFTGASANPVLPQSTVTDERTYLMSLREHRRYDQQRGYTVFGPHSDDLSIFINGQLAKNYASQGESRTLAHALKLSIFVILREHWKLAPLLLFDDMFADLDAHSLQALLQWIGKHAQSLLTCAQPSLLLPALRKLASRHPQQHACFLLTSPGHIAQRQTFHSSSFE